MLYFAKPITNKKLSKWVYPVYKILNNKYYVDEIYNFIIIKQLMKFAAFINIFDRAVVDGFINLVGKLTVIFSRAVDVFDMKAVDGAVNKVADMTYSSGKKLRLLQTGNASSYLVIMFGAVAVFVIYLLIKIIFIR